MIHVVIIHYILIHSLQSIPAYYYQPIASTEFYLLEPLHNGFHLGRGAEIKQWLQTHTVFSMDPSAVKFVIIDDDHAMSIIREFPSSDGPDVFIQTIMRAVDGDREKEGLTCQLAERAIDVLKS
jgi:hypothetical protein